MSRKVTTKYYIFGGSSKKSEVKSPDISENLMEISQKNSEIKKVTILEHMSDKIEDPDIAIETLKKELEKNLAKYNTK